MIRITQMAPEHIPQLVRHQQVCFPTLHHEDLFSAEHFAAHLRLFPQGQHVALDGDRVVGQSSSFRVRGEKVFVPHTFHDIIGHGYFTEHEDDGEWLYGADMSVHPDYRGQRIASMLYDARKALIRSLGLRGMLAGGMIPGYAAYRGQLDVEDYVAAVVAGRMTDPTLTPQLRNGFVVRGVLRDHLRAGELGPDATLIVWEKD